MSINLANSLWITGALILAFLLASPIQEFYCDTVGICSGGFFGFDLSILRWMSVSYIFFIVFLLITFGRGRVHLWIGISLIPAILFEVLIDPLHIYFPIAIGLVAWGLGHLANKALRKLAPEFMARIS